MRRLAKVRSSPLSSGDNEIFPISEPKNLPCPRPPTSLYNQLKANNPFYFPMSGLTLTYLIPEEEQRENEREERTALKQRIKTATLIDLITQVTTSGADEEFRIHFIWSYPTFSIQRITSEIQEKRLFTAEDLLDLLILRYEGPSTGDPNFSVKMKQFDDHKAMIRISVRDFLLKWITYYPFDFAENKALFDTLNWFINNNDPLLLSSVADLLNNNTYLECPLKFETKNCNFTFESFAAEELVQELCLIDYEFFSLIRPRELLKQAWCKSGKELKAPNILNYLEWFNRITWWAASIIVKHNNLEVRVSNLTKLIDMAALFRANNNFAGLMASLFALNCSAVSRLKQTWAEIKDKALEKFNQLNSVMDPKKNFKNYREALSTCIKNNSTCVPFLGVILSDFTFFDDGNPDTIDDELINFVKSRMMAQEYIKYQKCVQVPFKFTSNKEVRNFLAQVEAWNEDDLIRASKLIENTVNPEPLPKNRIHKSLQLIQKIEEGTSNPYLKPRTMTERDWNMLLSCSNQVTFQQGDVIIEENSFNKFLYRIKSGKVNIIKTEKKGNEMIKVILSTLSKNQIFGEMSLLNFSGSTSAAAIAISPVEVYVMEFQFIEKLFKTSNRLMKRFYYEFSISLAERLDRTQVNVQTSLVQHKNNSTDSNQLHEESIEIRSLISKQLSKFTQDPSQDIFTSVSDLLSKRLSSDSTKSLEDITKVINERDRKFLKRFKLPPSQWVIQEFPCTLKKSIGQTGELSFSRSYMCFYSKLFGIKLKKVFEIEKIDEIVRNNNNLIITINRDQTIFNFEPELIDEVEAFVKGMWIFCKKNPTSVLSPKQLSQLNKPESPNTFGQSKSIREQRRIKEDSELTTTMKWINWESNILTEDDWKILIGGTKVRKFKKGDVIIQSGVTYHTLHQLTSGKVNVIKEENGEKKILATISPPQSFGEASLVLQRPTRVSVIADTDDVCIHSIEGYFINMAFTMKEGFAGRFYKYLCTMMARRIFKTPLSYDYESK